MTDTNSSSISEMYTALWGDLQQCARRAFNEDVTDEDEQFWLRMITRSAFAFIEGTVFCLKQQAYRYYQSFGKGSVDFTEAELSFMLEEDYELNEKGEVVTQHAKVPLTKSIRLAFRVFARACFTAYELKVDDHRWDSFKRAIKIRDRLMHPKRMADLIITDEECDFIIDTVTWFQDNIDRLFNLTKDGLLANLKIAGEERERLVKENAELKAQTEMLRNLFRHES